MLKFVYIKNIFPLFRKFNSEEIRSQFLTFATCNENNDLSNYLYDCTHDNNVDKLIFSFLREDESYEKQFKSVQNLIAEFVLERLKFDKDYVKRICDTDINFEHSFNSIFDIIYSGFTSEERSRETRLHKKLYIKLKREFKRDGKYKNFFNWLKIISKQYKIKLYETNVNTNHLGIVCKQQYENKAIKLLNNICNEDVYSVDVIQKFGKQLSLDD